MVGPVTSAAAHGSAPLLVARDWGRRGRSGVVGVMVMVFVSAGRIVVMMLVLIGVAITAMVVLVLISVTVVTVVVLMLVGMAVAAVVVCVLVDVTILPVMMIVDRRVGRRSGVVICREDRRCRHREYSGHQ